MCHVAAGEVAGNNRAHQAIHCSLIQSHVARPSRGSHHRLLMLLLPLLLLSEKRTTRGGGGEAKLRPASWSHKKKNNVPQKKDLVKPNFDLRSELLGTFRDSLVYFSPSFLELKNTIFFGTNYRVLLEMLPLLVLLVFYKLK
jgi:hypothetical protein